MVRCGADVDVGRRGRRKEQKQKQKRRPGQRTKEMREETVSGGARLLRLVAVAAAGSLESVLWMRYAGCLPLH